MTNVIRLSKKAFTWSVIALTIAWSMGIAAFVPTTAHAATLSAGDLIRIEGNSAVYLLNADLERMYFPNADVYYTWYEDFSGVNVVSPAEASAYQLADNGVNYRAGSRLVKMTDLPTVYAVGSGNMLHPLATGEVAVGLYGANWGSILRDLPAYWFTNYEVGAEITEVVPHDGMLVSEVGDDTVYFVSNGMLHEVEGSLGLVAGDVKVVSAAAIAALSMGDSTTAGSIVEDPSQGYMEGSEPTDPSDPSDPVVGDGGDVTVRLAASTAASDTVPGGAQAVPYLTFTMAAGNDDARLEAITFTRRGIGSDDDFNKIYLYIDGQRVDSGRSLNSDDEVRFSPNYMIDAGETVTMMVKADMDLLANNATSGAANRFEIMSASDVVIDGGNVSGSFPVRGNDQVIGSVDIGSVAVTKQGADTTVEIGESDVKVSEFKLANGSNSDDVEILYMRLENKGSAEASILSNIILKNGGSIVAEGTVSGDYVEFSFDEPLLIEEGDDETFRVMADVGISDSSDTIQLILDETTDIEAYSTDFTGYRAQITNTSLNSANAMTVTLSGGEINVDFDGTNEDIPADEDNLVFGTFTVVATAEDIDVDSIQFDLRKNATDPCLEDLRIRDKNGRGSYTLEDTDDCAAGDTDTTYTAEDLILEQGVEYAFEVVADVPSTAGAGDQYTFAWKAASTTAEGVSSDNTVSADDYSSANLTGPTMTVAAPSVTVRANALTDETVVNGVQKLLVFRGTMEAARVSDMTLTTLTAGENGATQWNNLVAGLSLYIGDDIDPETGAGLVDTDNSVDSEEAVFDGFEYTIEAGSSNKVTFEIYADIEDGDTTGDVTVEVRDLEVSDENGDETYGIDSDDAEIDENNTVVSSRVVTVAGTGSLNLVVDNNMTGLRNARYVMAGDQSYLAGRIKLQADNEDVKLTDLVLVSSANSDLGNTAFEDTFESVGLYSSSDLSEGSLVASRDMVSGTITFEDVDYIVEDGQTQYLYLGLVVNSIGTGDNGTATATMDVMFRVEDTGLGAEGVDSNDDLDAASIVGNESVLTKNVEVVGVKITDVSSSFADANLSGGSSKTLFTFQVTADAGDNTDARGEALEAELQRLKLEISSDLGTVSSRNVTSTQLCREDTGNCIDITTDEDLSNTVTVANFITAGDAYIDMTNFSNKSDYEVESGDTVTYVVKGTISNVQDNSSVQVVVTDLNSDGLRWGYDVNGDSSAIDVYHTDMRKDSPRGTNYPRVVGGSLNN